MCLTNYIGLKGCGLPTPASGRYVNSLPGVSIKVLDNIADSEKVTYIKVWEAIQERALSSFIANVSTELAKRFRLKTILESLDLGELVDKASTTNASAQYRGFVYSVNCPSGSFKKSSLQVVHVQRIKYFATADQQNVVIKIFDVDIQRELFSATINASEGWNYIEVNKSFKTANMFVCYDATDNASALLKLNEHTEGCCDLCVKEIYGNNCTGTIKGCVSDISNPYQTTVSNNLHGVSAEFSLLCSFDAVVCSNKKVFELAYWYKLGEEIMVERLLSSRVNLTTIDQKDAEQARAYFMENYAEHLKNAASGIDLDLSDCCIVCNAAISYQESTM